MPYESPPDQMRVVSYGGGVQSTALLVLAAQGYIPHDTFLFSNVGDDSEHPTTLKYVREVAFDYAAAHGITLHELHREPQRGAFAGPCPGAGREPLSGDTFGDVGPVSGFCPECVKPLTSSGAVPEHRRIETLWGRLMRPESRSLPIPVRMSNGAPGTRSCTADFKIRVVGRWLRDHGATAEQPAEVAIGISTDEYTRATNRRVEPYEQVVYPLLHLEHRLAPRGANRDQCKAIIASAGLPIPPKSSCFFCPFHRPTVFADQARTEPELFARTVTLERTLNDRRDTLGKDHVYLTRFGRPIEELYANVQLGMLDEWDEDEGYRCGDVCDT